MNRVQHVYNHTDPADVHHSILHKYEFFLAGLTFAILGLAVQTADFKNAACFAKWFELVSWALLLGAALFNVWRVDRLVEFYRKYSKDLRDAQFSQDADKCADVQASLDQTEAFAVRLSWMRYLFLILGIICLAVSRGSAAFY